uniref:SAM domain-containing protein n=1 Tax=Bursaphelenchus xylophilus TaxID=6326 RepID=A0A1I7SHE6_BURXY
MNNHDSLFNNNNQSTTVLVDEDSPDSFEFQNWQSRHVLNWLKGLDDAIGPFIRLFAQKHIDGWELSGLDNDRLRRLGVNKEKLRCKIVSSIDLLYYYQEDIDAENAQKLALKVTVCVQNLLNAVQIATPVILSPNQSSKSLVVLNSVLLYVADLHEDVAKLIFWLDRHPFNEKKWFTEIRDRLALLINEIVDCINDPNNPKFFSVPQLLVEVRAL